MKHTLPWFQHTILYQIYPRSFYDVDNNGTGDLKGIIKKLDYIKGKPTSLGIDTIWISPFYPSPMADFGYDVSNYCDVDPLFGTLEDFDTLIAEAHAREIKILIDYVPNHTSDHHPWFEESRLSKDNRKRDWYIWRDGRKGGPPNNWRSIFGGSAWQFDNNTNQYYLHSFLKEQPDLNWANPVVRQAMKKVMKFWFDRGVDGFRIDAAEWLAKDPLFRDDPQNPHYNKKADPPYKEVLHAHSKRQPESYEYLAELAGVAKKYKDRFLIAESYPHKRFQYSEYLSLYEKVDPSVLAPFNFEGIFLPWEAQAFKKYIDGFQARMQPNYLPVYAMGNHDTPRIVARFGSKAARIVAMLLLTLPGMPVIYYGDELGMDNVPIPRPQARDPLVEFIFRKASRDPQRTPMQWTAGPLAGFSKFTPWLPVGKHAAINVQSELKDKHSMLNLYRDLIALRRDNQVLHAGSYRPIECYNKDLFAFAREYGERTCAVIMNFSRTKHIDIPLQGKLLYSTHSAHTPKKQLQPLEGRIIEMLS